MSFTNYEGASKYLTGGRSKDYRPLTGRSTLRAYFRSRKIALTEELVADNARRRQPAVVPGGQ